MDTKEELAQFKKLQELETILFKKLSKNCFIFIDPLSSVDEDLLIEKVKNAKKILSKQYQKEDIKKLVDEFIKLSPVEEAKFLPYQFEIINGALNSQVSQEKAIDQPLIQFLSATYWLTQLRWYMVQPQVAVYALEFFLDPEMVLKYSEEDKLDEIKKTIIIDMPFALVVNDKTGEFDLEATIKQEQKYHLIKSKFTSLVFLETLSELVKQEFEKFTQYAFFVIGYSNEIKNLALLITESILDYINIFAYDQLTRSIPPSEVKVNARGMLEEANKAHNLDKLIVYRADKPINLGTFIKFQLAEIKKRHPKISDQLVKEFYSHIFSSLSKLISKNTFYLGHFFGLNIRAATDLEWQYIQSVYTLILNPVSETGKVIPEIKEFYKIRLTDSSRKQLVDYATNGLKYSFVD